MGRRGRTAGGSIALALLVVVVGAGVDVSAQQAPRVLFTGSDDGTHMRVLTADLAGDAIQISGNAEPFATIDGGLAAFTRHHRRNTFASDVMIEDATTGTRVDTVDDARYPLIFDDGTALVFLPDNNGRDVPEDRDAFVNSVWYRDLTTGEETKLAQLEDPDRSVLHLAASPDGERVAFTVGNDFFLFVWNIWVSNVDGTGLQQITTDDQSLYPSFSPDGQTIAFMHLDPDRRCSGSVHLMDVDGSNARSLATGSCGAIWLRPIWLDDQTLVVWRWERADGRFNVPAGLVTMSAETGAVLDEFVTGRVFDFAVAREAGLVAFRMRNGRIAVRDVASGERFPIPGGRRYPFGHVHVDGSLELGF